MPFVTEPFQAYLSAPLEASAVTLSLSANAYADLLKLLQDADAYTYLSIKDNTNFETVKAYAQGGYILLDRGQAGTKPVKFSFGACLSTLTPTAIAVIDSILKDSLKLCDHYYNPDAMGGQLGVAFTDLPVGRVGSPWRGMIVLGGTLPVQVTVSGVPSWVTAVHYENMVEFTGTPPSSASAVITLHAVNTQENIEINQQFTIAVR